MNKPHAHILIKPRITEKGAYLAERGVYVFDVAMDANKHQIALAIRDIYKVTPRLVRIAAVPRKAVQTRGANRWGKTAAGKKAYVYLKKGETIELV
jgi:large subunit ribosomal protein L23